MVTHAVSDCFSSLGGNAEYLAFCFVFKNSVILPSKQQTGKVCQQSSPCASTHESPVSGLLGEIELWCCVMTTKQAAHMTFRPETNNCILNISFFLRHVFVCVCVCEKWLCRGSWRMVSRPAAGLMPGPIFSHTWGSAPRLCDPVLFSMLGCERTFFPHWALVLYFLFHSSAIFLSHFFPDLIP